jgi:hypothetical protein
VPFIGPILVFGQVSYWRQRKGYLHSGFAEYVDQLLERDMDVTVDIYRSLDDKSNSDEE